MPASDPIVLSFFDTLVRMSDVDLLKGQHWLNDSLIGFYFEYLQKLKYKDFNDLLFVSPEVTQCIKGSTQEDLAGLLDPLDAKDKKFIFFPVNDSVVSDESGGSHWSLLVYSKVESNTFLHFDSMSRTNYSSAGKIVMKLAPYLAPEGSDLEEFSCLRQENSYDCGIHVLCNAENIASHACIYAKVGICPILDQRVIDNHRKVMLGLIRDLAIRGTKMDSGDAS
jgi:sentrin-specific protease 8